MKILVLDTLIKQSSDSQQVSKEALGRIFDEYKTLASLEKQGKTAIDAYLSSQNGKKLNNSSIKNIFKYRLNAGDRILYTYGKYLPYIRDDDKDSMVLLGYAKHDDQSFFAQNKDFAKNHFYKELRKLVSTFEELKVNGDEEFLHFVGLRLGGQVNDVVATILAHGALVALLIQSDEVIGVERL